MQQLTAESQPSVEAPDAARLTAQHSKQQRGAGLANIICLNVGVLHCWVARLCCPAGLLYALCIAAAAEQQPVLCTASALALMLGTGILHCLWQN